MLKSDLVLLIEIKMSVDTDLKVSMDTVLCEVPKKRTWFSIKWFKVSTDASYYWFKESLDTFLKWLKGIYWYQLLIDKCIFGYRVLKWFKGIFGYSF